jgi:hypothetical protein
LDHRFAETVRGRDENHLVESRLGIEREHDPARREIAPHHALHGRGQRDIEMRIALMHAI